MTKLKLYLDLWTTWTKKEDNVSLNCDGDRNCINEIKDDSKKNKLKMNEEELFNMSKNKIVKK